MSFVLHTKFEIICSYVDPNLYHYCKCHLWSWHAEAQHPRTDALGVTVGLILDCVPGRMDKVVQTCWDEYEQKSVSDNRRSGIGTHPSCRELKHVPGWDGGCV